MRIFVNSNFRKATTALPASDRADHRTSAFDALENDTRTSKFDGSSQSAAL